MYTLALSIAHITVTHSPRSKNNTVLHGVKVMCSLCPVCHEPFRARNVRTVGLSMRERLAGDRAFVNSILCTFYPHRGSGQERYGECITLLSRELKNVENGSVKEVL